MAKTCPNCGGLLRYDTFAKADMCLECSYQKLRIDSIMLQKTVQYMSQCCREQGITDATVLNQAVNNAVELQATERISLEESCQRVLSQLKEIDNV